MVKNVMSLKSKINNIAKNEKSFTTFCNANIYDGKIT